MDSIQKQLHRRGYWRKVPEMVSINGKLEDRCNYCGRETIRVQVYGHEQCVFCGTNVEPCCDGERYEVDTYW